MMLLYINLHWFRNTFSREEPQAQNIKLSNFKFATILQEEPDTGNVRPSRSNSMADEWVLSFYWVNYVFYYLSNWLAVLSFVIMVWFDQAKSFNVNLKFYKSLEIISSVESNMQGWLCVSATYLHLKVFLSITCLSPEYLVKSWS